MAKLEFTVEIAAPPDRVFAFFVPQRMPYWYGAEIDSRFEIAGGAPEFRVGEKVRISGRLGRRDISHTVVVTEYQWGRLLEWHFQDVYGVRGLQRWEIEPAAIPSEAGHPGTRVHMRDEYEYPLPGLAGRILDRLLTRYAVARRDLRELARLRKLAERRE